MDKKKTKEFFIKHKGKISLAFTLILCLIIAKLITMFVFTSEIVVGRSMMPTLENGDKGISDALFFRMGDIDRFDIVIFEKGGELLVKRVIALPGETIDYNEGVLKINGEVVKEDFISDYVASNTGNFTLTIGEKEYFVMGDNRVGNNSWDSRSFGPINYSDIKSVGLLIIAKCDSVTENGGCKGLKLVWPYSVK